MAERLGIGRKYGDEFAIGLVHALGDSKQPVPRRKVFVTLGSRRLEQLDRVRECAAVRLEDEKGAAVQRFRRWNGRLVEQSQRGLWLLGEEEERVGRLDRGASGTGRPASNVGDPNLLVPSERLREGRVQDARGPLSRLDEVEVRWSWQGFASITAAEGEERRQQKCSPQAPPHVAPRQQPRGRTPMECARVEEQAMSTRRDHGNRPRPLVEWPPTEASRPKSRQQWWWHLQARLSGRPPTSAGRPHRRRSRV
jgi:hypothetical protein